MKKVFIDLDESVVPDYKSIAREIRRCKRVIPPEILMAPTPKFRKNNDNLNCSAISGFS